MAKNEQMIKRRCEKAKLGRLRYILVLLAAVVVVCAGVYSAWRYGAGMYFVNKQVDTKARDAAERPWAHKLEVPGVPNLHKVSEDIYRGAQPSVNGIRKLKKLGVKTIVNLRSFHTDRDEIGDAGLAYEHIYMKTWHPEDKEVVRFLQIVTDPNRTPVFVHCKRGADRTGTMCSIYRIAVQDWSKGKAIEEMTKGAFGFYSGWQNLVNYLLKLDVDEMKRHAGLEN
jgi:protein tyrosine phosphatase (PTP) superfamily phosphohydrolase (DUF442 family)